MFPPIRRILLTCLLALWAGTCAAQEKIMVFAAASLTEALSQVGAAFTAATGTEVVNAFAGTSALARQIEQGAPADVFVSASADWMDRLAETGAVRAETRIDLLSNTLVLVAPRTAAPGAEITLARDTDLVALLDGGKLAMALVDSVPAGIYGKAALVALGLWEAAAPHVAQTDNVRAALRLVAAGAVPLGLVYASDAVAEPAVRIVARIDPATHPAIVYPAALTPRAPAAAATYLAFLTGSEARAIFAANGFLSGSGE